MSTFGHLLAHKHALSVGPVTLRGPAPFGAPKKVASVQALMKFEQTHYGKKSESDRISISYNAQTPTGRFPYWNCIAILPVSEVRAYGKNVIGFDDVRIIFADASERDAVAVWLDEVLSRTEGLSTAQYFIEESWPQYGSRDEILPTSWHRLPTVYHSEAEARKAMAGAQAKARSSDASFRVVTHDGHPLHPRFPTVIGQDDEGALFGLRGLGAFINPRRRYHLTGDLWQGKSMLQSQRRLTLERFDTNDDAAFFLYFHDGGLVSRVHERTVAAPNKWVSFKKGKYSVRVLRADLLKALEALA